MLKLEDLYVGRRVCWEELQDIYDTYIVLENFEGHLPLIYGTVAMVSKDLTPELAALVHRENSFCVYNDSFYADERISCDD